MAVLTLEEYERACTELEELEDAAPEVGTRAARRLLLLTQLIALYEDENVNGL